MIIIQNCKNIQNLMHYIMLLEPCNYAGILRQVIFFLTTHENSVITTGGGCTLLLCMYDFMQLHMFFFLHGINS